MPSIALPPPAARNAPIAFAGGAIIGALCELSIVIPRKGRRVETNNL